MIRAATAADQPFLVEMLIAAVNWAPGRDLSREAVLTNPSLAHYVSGWPSPGEVGIIAEFEDDLVGAGWLRFFTSDDPGFGYVADDVPELSLAVVEAWRGRGIGRDLLRELIGLSSKSGIGRISLSVERDNFARSLYLEHGFEIVRHEVDADTMILNP